MSLNSSVNCFIPLICPQHNSPVCLNPEKTAYGCNLGCKFEVQNQIPRFVTGGNYASSFGLQWNRYRTTQLDSHTGLTISRDRLTRLLGGTLNVVKDKEVLEAGCGAGRFSEILLEAGAHLHAIDLSTAVEANYKNCGSFANYFVCQASILELPFAPEQFDVVICIGVIQHTPDPEQTINALCRQLKPGGLLAIDHYTYGYAATPSRRALRSVFVKVPPDFALRFCQVLVSLLWPVHQLLWRFRTCRGFGGLRRMFLNVSPVIDYQDAYPQLGPRLLRSWAILDTHDTLTDVYKHFRTAEEISNILGECGMSEIKAVYAGNGVEARARKALKAE